MKKTELIYESPEVEILEIEAEGCFAGSPQEEDLDVIGWDW